MTAPYPASILDLATVRHGQPIAESLKESTELAVMADELGFHRLWFAEHHNMETIASSATSVLLAHIGAHTTNIRLGAGGIMLPNHAPLIIAEQFGTLKELYGDRIDLGLGRAPGTDQKTLMALRRTNQYFRALPIRCVGTARLSQRRVAHPGDQRVSRIRHQCPTDHSGFLALRCTIGRSAGYDVQFCVPLRTADA